MFIFIQTGIVLTVIYGGSQLIMSDQLTPGELISFLVTAQIIQRSLAQLALLFGTAVKGLSAGVRVFEVGFIRSLFANLTVFNLLVK